MEWNEIAYGFPGGSPSTPHAPVPKDNNFSHPRSEIWDHTEDRSQQPVAFIQRSIILGLLFPRFYCIILAVDEEAGAGEVIIHSQFLPYWAVWTISFSFPVIPCVPGEQQQLLILT